MSYDFISYKNHPSGLKIFLASKLCNVTVKNEIVNKVVPNGAQFFIKQDGITLSINANSAVLKLFNRISTCDTQFLDLEAALQEFLIPYLQGVSSGKENSSALKNLTSKLHELSNKLPAPPQFISGVVGPGDVVIYCALLPLFANKESTKLLQAQENLCNYLIFLKGQESFKKAELDYFGVGGVSLEPWISVEENISCVKSNTESLFYKQQASDSSSSNTSPTSELGERIVSIEDISKAETAFKDGPLKNAVRSKPCPKVSIDGPEASPIVPVEGEKNILITAALPYVNNEPHLGNIIGCVLSADCYARFSRLRGDNTLYICGTDEYGTATETKALAEGMSPKDVCTKYFALHRQVYAWFNISFDYFGRTTTDYQTKVAQGLFWKLHENNFITQQRVEQLFCTACQRFLADRFVEGTCPQVGCGYEDARGDQCDACGKLVNAIELIKPRCKVCSATPVIRDSNHLFLDLAKLVPPLKDWVKESSPGWTTNARVICESWLRDGLHERCITRDLSWGTPVPLEGFKEKVFYVWFDAPIGYISITMAATKEWELWWRNPDNVSYYEFMAKDNVPFHSVVFPACLIGSQETWTKVTHLKATEYLNYEDGKFSKSRGVGVFGIQAKDTGIASDVWRFYLLYVRPESNDTTFSWSDLQSKNNNELLNNLGNFVNRALKFVEQFCGSELPEGTPIQSDFHIMAAINQELDRYWEALSVCRLRDGIRYLLAISRIGNQYIQENEPYKLLKKDKSIEDKRRGSTVIHIAGNIVALIAVLIQPYMPDTSEKILDILNYPETLNALPTTFTQFLKAGHKIKSPQPLIRKITDEEIQILRSKFAGEPAKETPKSKNSSKGEKTKPVLNGDPTEIARLEDLIKKQGDHVRDLKSQKKSKAELTPGIEKLLSLKKDLSLAQGIDPAASNASGKKKKK